MTSTFLKLIRRALLVTWTAALVGVVALVIGAHAAPVTGHDIYIIRGGSMRPAVPLGALVVDAPVALAEIRPGDIVTVRLHDAVVVTHRVTRVVDLPSGLQLELKGDANPAPDPVLVPAAQTVGRVVLLIPAAGYVLAMLSQPTGLISALSFLASLFLAINLLDQLAAAQRRREPVRSPVVGMGARA
jgi:signal peptidase I